MLILTRRVQEVIIIGDNVTVTVLGVKGNQVRLGINAPKDVAVHREEIYQKINAKNSSGCGACDDGCKTRGSCRLRDESPTPMSDLKA